MVTRSELRKEAYRYVLFLLSSSPNPIEDNAPGQFIPLDELRQIKEGVADPSPALVNLLKDLLQGTINDATIDSHLVIPFQNRPPE